MPQRRDVTDGLAQIAPYGYRDDGHKLAEGKRARRAIHAHARHSREPVVFGFGLERALALAGEVADERRVWAQHTGLPFRIQVSFSNSPATRSQSSRAGVMLPVCQDARASPTRKTRSYARIRARNYEHSKYAYPRAHMSLLSSLARTSSMW